MKVENASSGPMPAKEAKPSADPNMAQRAQTTQQVMSTASPKQQSQPVAQTKSRGQGLTA